MRTQKEIIARYESMKPNDFLGVYRQDLLARLDAEHVKTYTKPGVDLADWVAAPHDRESILKEMLEYMPFAWEKANNERGISAGRSLQHFASWVWFLGDEDIFGDLENYTNYGKGHLAAICKYYGWDTKDWE